MDLENIIKIKSNKILYFTKQANQCKREEKREMKKRGDLKAKTN